MKVAIISSSGGGLGHYAAHLFGPLAKQVTLQYISYRKKRTPEGIVFAEKDILMEREITTARFLMDPESLSSLRDLIHFLRRGRFDLVNIHLGTTARSGALFFLSLLSVLKDLGIPVVLTVHDVISQEQFAGGSEVLRSMYRLASGIFVGNEKEAARLQRFFDYPRSKITVSEHGIYNLFNFKRYDQTKARRLLRLPKQAKIVLFFGFLRHYKGLQHLVRAFPMILEQVPEAYLLVVSSTKYAESLPRYLNSSKVQQLRGHLKVILRYVPTKHIEPIMKASDVVALPYLFVSQSGILKLAQGFSKPAVITTVFPDARGFDGKFGYVVPPADPKQLAERISIILKNDRLASRMGQASYQYALKRYSWDRVAAQYVHVFKKLVG
ncbi:MAG: glycosyltransferase [Patescibacteria group bacterium]